MGSDTAAPHLTDPDRVMDPRRLGALMPNRLSASRAFLNTMIREGWRIDQDLLELDARGNGRARYTVTTPKGSVTFLAWLNEPRGGNRTGRIVGTSWDMIGSLIDGVATDEMVAATENEINKLYEGRAPAGTLVWFRSNQSLRVFQHVRSSLAAGVQPDASMIKRVGYLMRNTGLDGNGTFGTTSFAAIPAGHPLATSYFAQMLSAYLMRELAVDVVERLAALDNPTGAVRLSRETKHVIGVGNGSALGLVMFVYNRPKLIDAYLTAYLDALQHVLAEPIAAGDPRFDLLDDLLGRAIRYRTAEDTQYRVFTGGKEHAADLRRIRGVVRTARRGEIEVQGDETLLAAVHRLIRDVVSPEAESTLNSLLLELTPEYCDRLVSERLVFSEELLLDPATPGSRVLDVLDGAFRWALDLPLNDEVQRDRVWYQSRAAEEPRSGPRDEVPEAHEVVPSYPVKTRELRAAVLAVGPEHPIGLLLAERPDLEQITRLVLSLADHPYAVPHADPHDSDFVPVWVIRLMNSFIHGLDRTEDYLNRNILGLIYEGAPFRDDLATADPSAWWWDYRPIDASDRAAAGAGPATGEPSASSAATTTASTPASITPIKITPRNTSLVAPRFPADERITVKHREARLVAGRAYQGLGVPEGSWHGAREFFLAALLADPASLSAFGAVLARSIDAEGHAPPWVAPTAIEGDAELAVDGHGQSLLVVGHVLVNLIGGAAASATAATAATDRPGTRVTLRHTPTDSALPGLELALNRYGVVVRSLVEAGDTTTLVVGPASDSEAAAARHAAALDRLLLEGLDLPAQTWWDVYYPAHAGMYPDSDISRQHTGMIKEVYQKGQQLTKQFLPEELLAGDDWRDSEHESGSLPAADHARLALATPKGDLS